MGTAPAVDRTKLGSFSDASILLSPVPAGGVVSLVALESWLVSRLFFFENFTFFAELEILTFNLSMSARGSKEYPHDRAVQTKTEAVRGWLPEDQRIS